MRLKYLTLGALIFTGFTFAKTPVTACPHFDHQCSLADINSFFESGKVLLDYKVADLNGDGLDDYLVVLEDEGNLEHPSVFEEKVRTLKILLRQADGSLKQVKVNKQIIACSACGGLYGDPYLGIQAGKNTFSVHLFGGSGWRVGHDYEFDYDPGKQTWLLNNVRKTTYQIGAPDTLEIKQAKYPQDIGEINIENIDPEQLQINQ